MLRGIYISTTAMMTGRKRMDMVTNNLTNVDTTGYKKDIFVAQSFRDVMLSRLHDPKITSSVPEIGLLNYGVHIDMIRTDFSQGPLEVTDRRADIALEGDGFFVVDTPEGERFTRAGNFYVNMLGFLVNGDGYQVMGENGAIFVENDDFAVNRSGDISNEAGFIDTLRIVAFEDLETLRKAGHNLYTSTAEPTAADGNGYAVLQGMLEGSNVDSAREMADMINLYRSYEANSRILRMADETLGRAMNNIASV